MDSNHKYLKCKQKCDILEKIISQSGGDITLIKFTLDDFSNFYLQKYNGIQENIKSLQMSTQENEKNK